MREARDNRFLRLSLTVPKLETEWKSEQMGYLHSVIVINFQNWLLWSCQYFLGKKSLTEFVYVTCLKIAQDLGIEQRILSHFLKKTQISL